MSTSVRNLSLQNPKLDQCHYVSYFYIMNRPIKKNRNGDDSRALALAEMIIENSPSILFRRLAADDPKQRKMVYVSPNISRFGYRAEDFLNDTIMFRDILYQGDLDRTLQEIKNFVEKESEIYTQVYRIITKSGDVRWVEDQTSIYVDPETGIRYHQGIVTDIHERMVAEEKFRKITDSLEPEDMGN